MKGPVNSKSSSGEGKARHPRPFRLSRSAHVSGPRILRFSVCFVLFVLNLADRQIRLRHLLKIELLRPEVDLLVRISCESVF